jgi:hypothetical protein
MSDSVSDVEIIEDLDPTLAAEILLEELSSPKELDMRSDTLEVLARVYYDSYPPFEDVEEKIQGAHDEEFLEEFFDFKQKIARYFDNYWSIVVDVESDKYTFSFIHHLYKLFYVDVLDTIAKYIAGAIYMNEPEDFKKLLIDLSSDEKTSFTERFIEKYLGDEETFEFDDFFTCFAGMDYGRSEIDEIRKGIYDFINFDNQSFRVRLYREAMLDSNTAVIIAKVKKLLIK